MSDQKWSTHGTIIAGFATLAVLVGGFGYWAATAQITGAIIASGRIEVEQNRQIVQHPDGGVVAELLIREGDIVTAGDLLIRLDSEEIRSELTVVESQLFEIVARRGRYEAERDNLIDITFDQLLVENNETLAAELMAGQSRLYAARRESEENERQQLSRRRDQILTQVEGISAQKRSIEEQLRLIEQELGDQQSLLERGLAQATRVLALQREAAALSGQMAELSAGVAQAEGRVTEIEIEILKLDSTRREDAISNLRDLQYTELELRERRRTLLLRLAQLDIRAPVSGVVYDLRVFGTQSVVSQAEPILYLVPQDRPLVISSQVEPRDIDQLHLGQEVALRFSAFDQRQTPELYGQVVTISADAFQDEATLYSFYRAEIELSEGEQNRLPEGATLLPGMPVEAFIKTEDRTPIEYLVKPLTDFFAKAFREN